MARRLATLARVINEEFPELFAKTYDSHCNTDRKVGRLRWAGQGRDGTNLVVTERSTGQTVFSHNSAEPYRLNSEVEEFLEKLRGNRLGTFYDSQHQAVQAVRRARGVPTDE